MTLLWVQVNLYFSRTSKESDADGMGDKKFGIKFAVSGRKVRSDACPLPPMLPKSQVRRWNVSILITTPAKISILTA